MSAVKRLPSARSAVLSELREALVVAEKRQGACVLSQFHVGLLIEVLAEDEIDEG